MDAQWWIEKDGETRCLLCPHLCIISHGNPGLCGVREVQNREVKLPGYGMLTATAADPVEKKPLYHFYPGETVWSVGFAGCNMDCPFCQNNNISRANPSIGYFRKPEDVVGDVVKNSLKLLAFTYSEPTINYEYLIQTNRISHDSGLKNILVTNGNLNKGPARKLLSETDAVNIDLKSWDTEYYKTILGGSLDTVKDFIVEAMKHCWVELTTLIVPGDNDNEDDMRGMCQWIASLSVNMPLHLTAYHPHYKYRIPATSTASMHEMKRIAKKHLNYVYIGNQGMDNNTRCPSCSGIVVHRRDYSTTSFLSKGYCNRCGAKIPGVYSQTPMIKQFPNPL